MKKWLLSLLFLSGTFPAVGNELWLEAKTGFFSPTSSDLTDYYSSYGPFVGAEVTGELINRWYGFVGSSWFRKNGSSIGLEDKTTITLVPITAGFKYLQPINDKVEAYFGLGFQTDYVHFHDYSPFVIQKSSGWGFGGMGKLGFLFTHHTGVFLDVSAEYAWLGDVHFSGTRDGLIERVPVNVSGFSGGVALGYRFGCKD